VAFAGEDLADRIAFGDVAVRRAVAPHALLGDAHDVVVGDRVVTAISAIDWERPTRIPAIAAPGRLPPGAGTIVLNAIAARARRAGVAALRYAGPYPTPALFRSLARSFRTRAGEDEFTRDLVPRMRELARDELAIDFAPAPHDRVATRGGALEVRDGIIERALLGELAFERGTNAVARIVDDRHAEIWFGDAPYARVATIDPARAQVIDGPHPIAPLASRVLGAAFPPPLRAALAELVADAVPSPLADDARALVGARELAWADLGGRAARATGDGFAVHAALWERVAPHGLARLALAIAEALAPVVAATLVAAWQSAGGERMLAG
jgi:hypothetical protein